MKVSIIVPVYNEFPTLPTVLERVLNAPLPLGCSKEVIVVDDGSTDGTTELLKQFHASNIVVVHHSVVNFGKGAAVRVGIAKATGDVVLVQDGDLEYDPNDYPTILAPIMNGSADVVYGSRFLLGVRGMKKANWIANKILTIAANMLFGTLITDEATAYKAFRIGAIRAVRLKCLRFEFCPEVTAKILRAGYRIHEVPIQYDPRGVLEGKKIRWQDGFAAIWTLVRYRFVPLKTFLNLPTAAPPSRSAEAVHREAAASQ